MLCCLTRTARTAERLKDSVANGARVVCGGEGRGSHFAQKLEPFVENLIETLATESLSFKFESKVSTKDSVANGARVVWGGGGGFEGLISHKIRTIC